MPFYDFKCAKCGKIVEEFFKISDDKFIECCGIKWGQFIQIPPGLSDPGGIGNKWTNDGYQVRNPNTGTLRKITKKFEKGKQVI